MQICERCQSRLPDDVIYCLDCGSRLDETATVVRANVFEQRPAPTLKIAAVVASFALAALFAYSLIPQTVTPVTLAPPTPTPEIVERVVYVPVTPTPTPKPRNAATPKPKPTPIDVDELRERLAPTPTPDVRPRYKGYLLYNEDGDRLRAICKNGRPSYWQLDRALTCMANGGVAERLW